MTETLEHFGKTMKAEPLGEFSIKDIARVLDRGHPCAVELEPGDGTYYNFLIVPAWAPSVIGHLDRYGMPANSAKDYIFVTKVDDTGGVTFVLWSWFEVGDILIHNRVSPWTAQIMTWWFKMLWKEINAL